MDATDNLYADLTAYQEIYHELVFERNHTIMWMQRHLLLDRNRTVSKSDTAEWRRHQAAMAHRRGFTIKVRQVLDRLYSHDAIEALYDFNNIDLGNQSDTEANRLEKELNALQIVIGKLENKYNLHYKMLVEYREQEQKLYLNSIVLLSAGATTLRHRLLALLYTDPTILWLNDDIEDHFVDNFGYVKGAIGKDGLTDPKIEKAANSIKKDVASAGVKDFLIVSRSTVRINPIYLAL
jgi:hypothetical protein